MAALSKIKIKLKNVFLAQQNFVVNSSRFLWSSLFCIQHDGLSAFNLILGDFIYLLIYNSFIYIFICKCRLKKWKSQELQRKEVYESIKGMSWKPWCP